MTIFIRAAHNYDADAVSNETAIAEFDDSKTQQNQRDEADINNIVKRFGLTGQLPTNVRTPQYGDFTGVGTYQESLNAVMAANASFMAMPAEVRKRFENDPAKFVDFCSDPANLEEMRKLGLAVPATNPTPTTNPTPAA